MGPSVQVNLRVSAHELCGLSQFRPLIWVSAFLSETWESWVSEVPLHSSQWNWVCICENPLFTKCAWLPASVPFALHLPPPCPMPLFFPGSLFGESICPWHVSGSCRPFGCAFPPRPAFMPSLPAPWPLPPPSHFFLSKRSVSAVPCGLPSTAKASLAITQRMREVQ